MFTWIAKACAYAGLAIVATLAMSVFLGNGNGPGPGMVALGAVVVGGPIAIVLLAIGSVGLLLRR